MIQQVLGDYQIVKHLDEALFGSLYLAKHRFMQKMYKILVLSDRITKSEEMFASFEEQIAIYARLSHPNISKLHTISSHQGQVFLVYDIMLNSADEEQNLQEFLYSQKERLNEEKIFSILSQIAAAVDYLHENGLYGGLNLKSIFIRDRDQTEVLLYNVGLSKVFGKEIALASIFDAIGNKKDEQTALFDRSTIQSFAKTYASSIAFLAPEEKAGAKDISMKVDQYAVGVITYFLFMGFLPEGYFPLPSTVMENTKIDWDVFLKSLLSPYPAKRRERLSHFLEEVSQRELTTIFKKIESKPYFAPPSDPMPKKTPSQKKEEAKPVEKSKNNAPSSPYGAIEEELINRANYKGTAVKERIAIKKTTKQEKEIEAEPVIKPSELQRHEYEENPGAIFEKETVIKPYKPQEREAENIEPLLTEMIVVEGGDYMRGCNSSARDERPRHKIFIHTFALDIHPVTNEQFIRFLEAMGGEKDVNNNDMILLKESRIKRFAGKLTIESGYTKHPVVGVSWYGAKAYAKWVGKRLPTEAEWEIAASMGIDENIYPFGTDIERSRANFFSADTTPVMSYPPTALGLYDMAGNVYEWCEDWYDYNYYETSQIEPNNPKGPLQGIYRVLRGGCWKSLKEDLRTAHRHRNNPKIMNRTYGFRLAADVK